MLISMQFVRLLNHYDIHNVDYYRQVTQFRYKHKSSILKLFPAHHAFSVSTQISCVSDIFRHSVFLLLCFNWYRKFLPVTETMLKLRAQIS